jgi:O-antigen ligase/GT2 family glycosyltransferase
MRHSTMREPVTVSVIIKALNEERRIADAIESALAAIAGMDGEVILADGGSRDRTIEIARRYPVRIVRLNRARDRTCGAGAQLGFQYSSGQYLCLIDGDMHLQNDFVGAALDFLQANPTVAGVGGHVVDRELSNLEFEQRTRRYDPDRRAGLVTRLNSSGFYRRSAIEAIGYLTDRNLHGAEELDLAARLHAAGWKLARLDRRSVDHFGHTGNPYRLLLRRITTRNSFATGELVRAAIGQRHFWYVVGKERGCLLTLLVGGWWATIASVPFALSAHAAMVAAATLLLLPIAAMSLRWGSLRHGLYSFSAWNVYALSFLPDLLQPRVSPTDWIDSTVVTDSSPMRADCSVEQGAAAATASRAPALRRDAGNWRGFFTHKNGAGAGMAILVCIGIFVARTSGMVLGGVITALAAFFLLHTESKSPISLLPFVLIISFLLMRVRRPAAKFVLAITLPAAIGVLTIGSVTFGPIGSLVHQMMSDPSFTGRDEIWLFTLDQIAQRPIVGFGFQAFWGTPELVSAWNYLESWGYRASDAHNGFLNLAVMTGFVGLALAMTWIFVQPLLDHVRTPRERADPALTMLFLQIWLFGLFISGFESELFSGGSAIWFMMVVAITGLRFQAVAPLAAVK